MACRATRSRSRSSASTETSNIRRAAPRGRPARRACPGRQAKPKIAWAAAAPRRAPGDALALEQHAPCSRARRGAVRSSSRQCLHPRRRRRPTRRPRSASRSGCGVGRGRVVGADVLHGIRAASGTRSTRAVTRSEAKSCISPRSRLRVQVGRSARRGSRVQSRCARIRRVASGQLSGIGGRRCRGRRCRPAPGPGRAPCSRPCSIRRAPCREQVGVGVGAGHAVLDAAICPATGGNANRHAAIVHPSSG
jgi:hypothetical protein